MVELYYGAKLAALRTGDKVRGVLRRVGRVYGWDERPVASITDDDAAAMLNDIAGRGRKAMANQTKHLCHAMFKWAKQPGQKFVTVNLFADLPAPGGANVKRKRFLTAAEIPQVWRALDAPERFEVWRDAATALRLTADARDVDAWTRAIAMARASDPARDQQITEMLKTRSFAEVGRFASYCQRGDNLRLKPWQAVPCGPWEDVDVILARGDIDPTGGTYAAAVLIKRLRNAGLSDYEPDPLRAIEAAEAARRPAACR